MKCFFCSLSFVEISEYLAHLKSEEKQFGKIREFPCVCGRQYLSFNSFRVHLNKTKCIESAFEHDNNNNGNDAVLVNESAANIHSTGIAADITINAFSNYPCIESRDIEIDALNNCRSIREIFQSIHKSICELDVTEQTTNEVYNILCDVVDKSYRILQAELELPADSRNAEVLEACKNAIQTNFKQHNSKRKRKKELFNSELYVAPQEKALGGQLQMKNCKQIGLRIPQQIQSKLYYVPIRETLEKLFANEHFERMYTNYNLTEKHRCEDGKWIDFCCGRQFKENAVFRDNPMAIQLQLFIDGFEPCDGLKSKTNIHPQEVVYFTIRNVPHKFAHSLETIHLVAICNTNDLKTKQTDYNDLWEFIVKDVNTIETIGVRVGQNDFLKGTIVSVVGDNLGLNSSLGFIRSFVGHHYCRHCEMPRSQCQRQTIDQPEMYRTKDTYRGAMHMIGESEKVDTKATKGLAQYCLLNDLKYFHVINNFSVDIMHDLLEGNVPFLLKKFFELGISKKVYTEQALINMCIQFDYGILDRCFIPTDLSLTSKTLGQNASQSRCLITNLPYILYKFKDKPQLKQAWETVRSLLEILTIVHASEIRSVDVVKLKSAVKAHLSSIINLFEADLLPKHHFTLHYARCIEEVGPIVHMSTLFYEMKHKTLTNVVKMSNNYVNVSKSIAENHQKLTALSNAYTDNIEHAALKRFDKAILPELGVNDPMGDIFSMLWLRVNGIYYRKDLIVMFEGQFHCIENVLQLGQKYLLVCTELIYEGFNEFLNSFEVSDKMPPVRRGVFESNLINKKTYCRKRNGNRSFVYANTVNMFHLIQNN